jgi:hypothetical protein
VNSTVQKKKNGKKCKKDNRKGTKQRMTRLDKKGAENLIY